MRLSRRMTWEMIERIVVDTILVNIALFSAFALRFFALLWLREDQDVAMALLRSAWIASVAAYLQSTLILTSLCLVSFYYSGFYSYGRNYQGRYKALVIFQAITIAYLIFGTVSYLFFDITAWFPRSVWIMGWLFTVGLLEGVRFWSALWRKTVWIEAEILGKPEIRSIRNVLVIGGAGYIGSILVRKLLDQGYRVTVLDALLFGDTSIQELRNHPNFKLIQGDIRDVEAVITAFQYADATVHLAGLVGDPACAFDEKLTLEINLASTRMLAEAARAVGMQRFIFASTCSVYGASEGILDEHSALNPVSLYARTKIDSERILLAMEDVHFHPVILRFGTIYGLSPRPRFDLVINLLAARAICEGNITIFGGDQWRPFVHVDDVAEAIMRALEAPLEVVQGEIFNVGSDAQNYRIAQLEDIVKSVMPGVDVIHKGENVDRRNYRVSFAKIHARLSFIPRHTVIDGIREIKAAIESGLIPDYQATSYSNFKTLAEGFTPQLIQRTHISPLYSFDQVRPEGVIDSLPLQELQDS